MGRKTEGPRVRHRSIRPRGAGGLNCDLISLKDQTLDPHLTFQTPVLTVNGGRYLERHLKTFKKTFRNLLTSMGSRRTYESHVTWGRRLAFLDINTTVKLPFLSV